MRLPTVKIHNPSDPSKFVIINESDFDPKAHKLWKERKPSKKNGQSSTDSANGQQKSSKE